MTRLEICNELKAAGSRLVGGEWVTDERVTDAWLAWRAASSPRGALVVVENSPDGREVARVDGEAPPVLE